MSGIRLLIFLLFAGILASLGTALFYLYSGKRDPKKMARALALRVALSLALFILLMVAWRTGLIAPRGLAH